MNRSVIVIDNNPIIRDRLCSEIGKTSGLSVISSSEMGIDAMHMIGSRRPEIVIINIPRSEYEVSKPYIQFLMDDTAVRFLTLSRRENSFFMLAIYAHRGTGASETSSGSSKEESEADFIDRLLSEVERLASSGSDGSSGNAGRYLLKGLSLQCA